MCNEQSNSLCLLKRKDEENEQFWKSYNDDTSLNIYNPFKILWWDYLDSYIESSDFCLKI